MAEVPFFIVGCPRSGTTLVRWMLREHPRLAIPPESRWLVDVALGRGLSGADRQDEVLDQIMRHEDWAAWSLPEDVLRVAVAQREPSGYAELVDTVYTAYAELRDKRRWGDKTPENVLHLDLLNRLFPNAVFVHVIRDGREVAASLAEQAWTSEGLVGKAYWWRDCVSAGRDAGRRLGADRYCELRLEDLVGDPERELIRVCSAIGEAYTPELLDYPSRSEEMDSWASDLRRAHQHLGKPPTGGLRDWQAGVDADERDAVTRICGPLLAQLGYEP